MIQIPKSYDYDFEKEIYEYVKTIRKGSMYSIGKYFKTTASHVSIYLKKLEKDKKVFSTLSKRGSRTVRYYSTSKDDLPKPKKQTTLPVETKVIEKEIQKIPEYYLFLDELFNDVIVSSNAMILIGHVNNLGKDIDEIIEMQSKLSKTEENKNE